METYTSGEGKNDCKMLFFQHRKSDIILGNSTKEGWKEIETENIFSIQRKEDLQGLHHAFEEYVSIGIRITFADMF